MNFSIDTSKGVDRVPLIPGEKPQRVVLESVTYIPEHEITSQNSPHKGNKIPRIEFVFANIAGDRQLVFGQNDPNTTKKPETVFNIFGTRFVNIYQACFGEKPDKDIFKKCKDIAAVFKMVSDIFNEERPSKDDAKVKHKIYQNPDGTPKYFWLIPVYGLNNSVELPIDKFIEAVVVKDNGIVAPKIDVNPAYHNIVKKAKEDSKRGQAGGAKKGNGAVDVSSDDLDDLPDID